MDGIWGIKNFRNEIIWQRTRVAKKQSTFFGKTHDIILLYTKSDAALFNHQFLEHPESYKKSHYSSIEAGSGRRYGLWDFTQKGAGPSRRFGNIELAPPTGKHWIWSQERIDEAMANGRIVFTKNGTPRLKRYLDTSKGEQMQDIWTDIFDVNAVARERLGYPTQKPEALLERIISASSNPSDIVLDPFCGCGTTITAAQRLDRRWIGIDITHLAVTLMKNRINDSFGKQVTYQVIGEPVDITGGESLAKEDPYQFQWWALGLVNARPVEQKKGADKGIDGRLYFHDEGSAGQTKQIIFSVKAGKTMASHVRDLRGVVDREKAAIGILISFEDPTREMRKEAASAGFYHSSGWNKDYPKLQLITVEELLEGKKIDYPPSKDVDVTYKKAPKAKSARKPKNKDLFTE